MSRAVTIHSDGTARGTVLIDEDGKKLDNIIGLTVRVEPRGVVEAEIEIQQVSMNMQAEVREVNYQCPVCDECMTHECDTQLGGGGSTVQTLSGQNLRLAPLLPAQYSPPWNYEICGKVDPATGNMCYINKDIIHTKHYDTRNDAGWVVL